MTHSLETVEAWLTRIIGHEGAQSMDPKDPGNWTGGKVGSGTLNGTKYGIAANTYPSVDIPGLTISKAAEIYMRDFVAPLKLDRYAASVAYQLLDFAVNSGIGRATKELQQAVGVTADGKIGPQTIAAVQARSETDLVMLVTAGRIDFMAGLNNWPAHGKGWMRRIAQNLRYGAEDS